MRLALISLIAVVLGSPSVGNGQLPCSQDGNPVPPFAKGRDANGCLLIPTGNPQLGDAAIQFEHVDIHPSGNSEATRKPTPPAPPHSEYFPAYCRDVSDKTNCTYLVWKSSFDGYYQAGNSSGDILANTSGREIKYALIKDVKVGGGYRCQAAGWVGPHPWGPRCTGSSSIHLDLFQSNASLVNDGWIVVQDSEFFNSPNQGFLIQAITVTGNAGVVYQGVATGRKDKFLSANNWYSDCVATRGASGNNGCENPSRFDSTSEFKYAWFVNTWANTGGARIIDADVIVVVNGGTGGPCDNVNGCDGVGGIGFVKGWPAPIGASAANTGPGTCPNGYIGDSHAENEANRTYCYTSIESVLADKTCADCPHFRPPFLQLSNTGWASPPNATSADRTAPQPPVLLP